jgi:hypothetical protein
VTDDLALIRLQTATLYRLDEQGRMLCVNEPDEPRAPRLFMGRTLAGNIWSFRHDLPADLVDALEQLCRAEPVVADHQALPAGYDALRAVLAAHAPVAEEYRGPCYRFPEQLPPPDPRARQVTADDRELLLPHFPYLARAVPEIGPVAVSLEAGRVAAVCFCSRLGERACEAGLETLPEHRRRGHGAAAAALWATLVRATGRTALYSTSWDNLASQGVARRLGLIRYGEDFSLA